MFFESGILSTSEANNQTKGKNIMAKATRLYFGYDSYGRSIEVAERVDGAWFWRDYGWNGYGNAWSKWQPHETPTFPSKVKCSIECANSPEYIEIAKEDRENRIEWGFNTLKIVSGPHRLRLPNP